MSTDKESISRRDLLGGAGLVGAGLMAGILPVHSEPISRRRSVGANDKLVIGLVGCGGMGAVDMNKLMEKPEVQVAALCDVDKDRMPKDIKSVTAKYGKAPDLYGDYRKMLERKDIDAIIVGTPDHWHALVLINAVEAGKDAYCEKPISHDITEAKSMAAAVKHYNKIVQVGTWQRSTDIFTNALNYVKSGKLGKISKVRAWKVEERGAGRGMVTTPPPSLDFDMWTGPAAAFPYAANHVHNAWRWFKNTGTGKTGDWGVHMIDIGLLGMSEGTDLVMPTEVCAFGGKFSFVDDDRDTPDTVEAIMRFKDPDFLLQWETGKDQPGKPDHGTEFVSVDGKTLQVSRGGWSIMDPKGELLPKERIPATNDHWQNWLDCVKSREQPRSNIASMAQTTITCHLINIALDAGESVKFSKEKMDIVGKTGKDSIYYAREYRKPWKLPIYK
ncbi:MAG: putative dehydrogenase [Chthonomonadaceae bacterium]|nr:putative dehydrogenase [Chthonomonadaceae bacterium]